ncbi:hypothetical protein B0T22DRAFT_139835 [Podospora appendiculata]|uniref:Uncharacterized protein n=1 Tax=Podospora appendiculata TaxID=314037 RepID=A0AAE0X8X4_9PEZI|nr:hypothetical protein B0T22DRAFT_139835 [Podospora appendiculata]
MESWDGYNYYTTNPAQWVMLMNLSTSEMGLAPLPPNLVAIPGSLNDSYSFPNNTIVIENASKSQLGSRDIEKIIFGVTAGVAILWGIIWLYWTWKRETNGGSRKLFRPRTGYPTTADATSETQLASLMDDGRFVSAEAFRNKLLHFYYENVQTGIEMTEKDVAIEGIDAEDVEAVTALVQKMYAVDLELWSHQSSRYVTEAKRNQLRKKSDAILAEVRRIANSWGEPQYYGRWQDDELEQVQAIIGILRDNIEEKRYQIT